MKATKRSYPFLVLLVAALLLAADQILKYVVLTRLKPLGAPVTAIPNLLEFTYVENRGVAFGLLQNQLWFIGPITLVLAVAILVLLFRYHHHSFFSFAASALLLSGGVGNLADRLLYGYVVDYIHVLFFPYVFNFADCCITVGAVCFVVHYLFLAEKKKQPPLQHAETGSREEP